MRRSNSPPLRLVDPLQDVQPDNIELANLSHGVPAGGSGRSTDNSVLEVERNDRWLLLRRSNVLSRFIKRVWDGPIQPKDDPPSFYKKYKLLNTINDFPARSFRTNKDNKNIRLAGLAIYCILWFSVVGSFVFPYLFVPSWFYPDDDGEKQRVITLSCNSDLYWEGHNNACGLLAEDCGPPENKTEFLIKCPALCDQGGIAYTAVAVGSRRVQYVNYLIGGSTMNDSADFMDMSRMSSVESNPFRADSFPCAAAVHYGIVSPFRGGCARVSFKGYRSTFPPSEGNYNTGLSVAFDSFFPESFSVSALTDGIVNGCMDPRVPVVILNILLGAPVTFLFEAVYGYWINTMVVYWTLVLALDPPILVDAHDQVTAYALLSVGVQRLLPLCFVLYVLWECSAKRTLGQSSPLLRLLLWYPLLWLGVMNNVTFDRLPTDRLNIEDLKRQPGAITAVSCILGTIVVCGLIQAYSLWKSGRFRRYFKLYMCIIVGCTFGALIPGLTLRLHHYILGIMLIPGCATRGASAYLFQGILLGLVLSGVARWDFASIHETNVSLLRGGAGAALKPPKFVFNESTPHILSWYLPKNVTDVSTDLTGKIDGYSLLLNDFEVYVGKNESVNLDLLYSQNEMLSQMIDTALQGSTNNSINLYLRVSRASVKNPKEYRGDYTNAGILQWPQGIWKDPAPGVS